MALAAVLLTGSLLAALSWRWCRDSIYHIIHYPILSYMPSAMAPHWYAARCPLRQMEGIIMIGEIGGTAEKEAAEFIIQSGTKKPVVIHCRSVSCNH